MSKRRKLNGEMSVSSGLAAEARAGEILKAAGEHDNPKLERLLKEYNFKDVHAVDVQNAEGTTPLHAAIASSANEPVSGDGCATVRLLLESGAIWNQLDKNDETPGCIAFRLGLPDLYEFMVDAGVRAEVLLNRLEGYERLEDDEEPEGESTDLAAEAGLDGISANEDEVPQLVDTAATATGGTTVQPRADVNSADYLSSDLVLTRDKLLDGEQNGVMMAWEADIMKRSVDCLLLKSGMKVLNIGAGMMIFDTFVQDHANKPEVHHIVEAHSDVLTNMESQGWDKKPGVTLHPGRWQDILPQLVAENKTFDAIYYDTFAESYSDFREFFTEYVLGLLEPDGKWSFFNGMGADRQISYDVYQKVVEMDLFEAGFDVEWHDIDIPELDAEWEGVKRKYWNVQKYRLPACRFMD
ncbi:Arginine N-methyltransferase 2 [Exophiala xenobiotica]|uniref:Arginine N-methyltransferase 2 n=1 Tax=Lithohypha guttulata TaxID=1690604 RepID=A0ABR0KLL7_9EURO|nr:Arginine N-methyltransferase 2 [Lithohypha guttulata]KAK5324657.1 Arginine N-methyltransferase 2 [Exophiala xenobiotica]